MRTWSRDGETLQMLLILLLSILVFSAMVWIGFYGPWLFAPGAAVIGTRGIAQRMRCRTARSCLK